MYLPENALLMLIHIYIQSKEHVHVYSLLSVHSLKQQYFHYKPVSVISTTM